tara:strand:- start:2106 stop:2294 length:189 start_codon:yes stop_codon:yes gene_type:complete
MARNFIVFTATLDGISIAPIMQSLLQNGHSFSHYIKNDLFTTVPVTCRCSLRRKAREMVAAA